MWKFAATVACIVLSGGVADAGDASVAGGTATMTCDRVDSPGRVRCEVDVQVAEGESIEWADVVIVKTPDFIGALRGRIGPHDATTHAPTAWRWALALVARAKGAGDVDARVRLVACRNARCSPREIDVKGHVVVGQ